MKHALRNCMMLVLGLAVMQAIAAAQDAPRLEGVWNVNVTIHDCNTGQPIRDIRALNLFIHDGSMTETGASIQPARSRSSSIGTWRHLKDNTYTSTFRFFRYNPDGSFFSAAKVTRMIELSQDGSQFISTGTVEDFDLNNVRIGVSCPTEMATRAE